MLLNRYLWEHHTIECCAHLLYLQKFYFRVNNWILYFWLEATSELKLWRSLSWLEYLPDHYSGDPNNGHSNTIFNWIPNYFCVWSHDWFDHLNSRQLSMLIRWCYEKWTNRWSHIYHLNAGLSGIQILKYIIYVKKSFKIKMIYYVTTFHSQNLINIFIFIFL